MNTNPHGKKVKTTGQHVALTGRPWHHPTAIIILLLVVIAAAGNFLGTKFILNRLWSIGSTTPILVLSGGGLLVAQVCLLAVWCALGRHNLAVRLQLTMGVLFGLLSCYIAALNSVPNLPLELVIFIVGIAITLTIFVQLPLWLLRWRTGLTITSALVSSPTDSNQFSIKHLLFATLLLALLVTFAQRLFPNLELDEKEVPWAVIFIAVLPSIMVSCLCCLLSLAVVFGEKYRGVAACGWLLTILAGPSSVFVFITGPTPSEALQYSYCFTAVLTIALLAVLVIFYLLGYRLRKLNSAKHEA